MKLLATVAALAVAVAATLGASVDARAAYPEETITVIVPFSAGGRTDLTGRAVAHGLEKALGVTVAVINKPGAGGVVGAKELASAKADGYTLGIFSSAVVSAQYTVETGTDLEDYKVVGLVESSPAAVAVKYDAPWKTLRDLVADAKSRPGELDLGMIPGASAQVFAGGFTDAAGVEMTMVPFNSDAPGVTALAGGHIDVHVAVPASYKTLSAAKKIRMLAVAADKRMPQLPDLPTMREEGVDLVIGSFHALFVPKDTPEEVIATLEAALQKAMTDPAVVQQMEGVGLGPLYMGREEAVRFIAGQDATYRKLIQQLGMMYGSKKP